MIAMMSFIEPAPPPIVPDANAQRPDAAICGLSAGSRRTNMFKIMPDATFCGKENRSFRGHGSAEIGTLCPKPHTSKEKCAQHSENLHRTVEWLLKS
jgi:hypothetical protein